MQKYKVFLNEKSILFCTTGKITITKPTVLPVDFTYIPEVKKWIDAIEKSQENDMIIESEDPATDFHNFRNALIQLDAAGGFLKRDGCCLFIFRNGKWDLPKGKIDKGETPEEAAIREVEEECGIQGHQIDGKLIPTYHVYRSPYKKSMGEWIIKKTHWFEMKYDGVENGTPETGEGITEIRWFKPEELKEVLVNTYENLKEMIESNCQRDT